MSRLFPSGYSINRVDVYNTSVSANTDIFPANIIPQIRPQAFFTVYCVFSVAGRLKVMRKQLDNTVVEEILNEDQDLKANSAYTFAVPCTDHHSINFQYSQNCNAITFLFFESEMR